MFRKRLVILATLTALAGLLAVVPATASDYGNATYEVTLANATSGQPISPPVFATHGKWLHLFRAGQTASSEIVEIAENGNQIPAFNLLSGLDGVTDVVDVGAPLLPAGAEVPGLSDTVTFTIEAAKGDRLSFAGMLICTNDGFLGADGVKLPNHGSKTYRVRGWDAGSEVNSELSVDIVDPCSGLGPVPLAGDPNGNASVDEDGKIKRHKGVKGVGDLLAAHDFGRNTAWLTITRLPEPVPTVTYEVTLTNASAGQPISPPVFATHGKWLHLFRAGHAASDEVVEIAENGNQGPAAALLSGLDGVTDVVDVGMPLTPAGSDAGGFSDTVTFTIEAAKGDRLSFAGMLICTNDGFIGVDGVRLPKHGSKTYGVRGWDAGSEVNSELSVDIVDPCSGLGPVPLAGDPNGNASVDEDGKIKRHKGVKGVGDLLAAHDFGRNTAWLTITRLPEPVPTVTYEVTLTNASAGQPISPPVFATHGKWLHLFRAGHAASDEVVEIAENGNQGPAAALLSGLDGVTDVVDVGMPLTPAGSDAGGFSDTVTFTIEAAKGDRLSFAGMLICTNDGFIGVDGVRLPKHGSKTYGVRGWDAGSEVNSELSVDIVDPCSGLGPVPLAGDPNGNASVDEDGKIKRHKGVKGVGDLLAAHDFDRNTAWLTITRIDG